MPTTKKDPAVPGMKQVLDALRDPAEELRRKYEHDPLALAARLGLLLPKKPLQVMKELGLYDPIKHGPITPGLRELVEDVCLGRERSAVVVGPRGGGKSYDVSFIEFFLVFFKDYDALNLAGSELQAEQVYTYILSYLDQLPEMKRLIKGEPLQSRTTTLKDAWIRVLTASQKSVRSPHAGGKKPGGRMAGGLLVIDEEAEADADIVKAALPTINTAKPSVNVRASTFHNATGSFAEVVDNHEEMGYKLYNCDVFDACSGCECGPAGCESSEKCFREDHMEMVTDPDTGVTEEKLVHRAYCGGRARYARGHVPIEEIETLWRRGKRNHATFEIEQMGSRPAAGGLVIKDRQAYEKNCTETAAPELFIPGWPVEVCVDWGTIAAGITVWQEQPQDHHQLLHADLVENAGTTQIIGAVMGYYHKYANEFIGVAADIGGGGNYLNKKLREEHGLPCRDVNFGVEKEAAAAAWNIINEANLASYPKEFTDFHDQMKSWKRNSTGHIVKKNDHLMDSSICPFRQGWRTDSGCPTSALCPKRSTPQGRLRNGNLTDRSTSAGSSSPRGGLSSSGMHRVAVIRNDGYDSGSWALEWLP